MELLATGFNAWHQVDFDDDENKSEEPDDISSFRTVLKDDFIGRPFEITSGIRQAGFSEDTLKSIRCKLLSSTAAIAGNGFVAEYDGHETICQYLFGTEPHKREQQTFSGMGQIVQLVAFETGFVALSQDGRVWTWGDERYSDCLGRPVTPSSSAERPGLVEELEDLPTGKISKVSAAGYLVLALTEGCDLYAWGGHPGRRAPIEELSNSPTPVVVEENDIADCGVGESHLIVLSSGGDVYVIGNNTNGQLGLPLDEARLWMKVPLRIGEGYAICGVEAGQRTSFILTKHQNP
ncbi:RCC1/BLIP-II [Hypoxylon sp. NC1633]|nr:RCC1/BLIP-II [Hypoxylon sp. NC1633]